MHVCKAFKNQRKIKPHDANIKKNISVTTFKP